MKRSSPAVDPPPCALNSDVAMLGNCPGKDERNYFPPNRTASGRTPQHAHRQKREPQCMNQSWSNNTAYDNSNASWESEWSAPSGTPPIKTDSAFYKNRNNPGPYQGEWSPSDSSASNSVASSYGMMHTPQQSPSNSLSASSSSFYENNGFYNNSGYGGYGQSAYIQQPPYGQHQQYQPVAYGSNRNPSSCPPTSVKQPVPDYHRRQMRYGLDGMPKVQIKREPEEYGEMDGENFTSLFTKSLTSLYSQDTENAFSEESKPYDADIMVCNTPTPVPVVEEPTGFQRLHPSSGGQYPANIPGDYPDARSNFGFYENRNQNCDPPSNVVQDIGADGNQMNSFRYDRPSFDDMHLYASSPSESKAQAKKRKVSMPNIPPEGGFTENRKKTPRLMSFKSDSKWTPNSFAFSEIQIKQEPTDDFNTSELNGSSCSRTPGKDSSSGSMGNGNGGNGKTPSQQSDHPKPPPRKRSPGSTCFDRFDKKSTPTNKKVSPLSVYAKVQENIVLNVKCRRYKKRTKPISNKEESACPGREEMENYKRSSLTPDQAAHQVMGELLERVCLFNERTVIDGPDLTQMDTMKVKELLMQFCHRYSLDYRDFEDVSSVLKTRIIKDKTAKNSERASAIRKRTSTSPVQSKHEPEAEPASRTPKGPKKSSHEDSTPSARRVLRKLPGRVDRSSRPRRRADSKASAVTRRYSTRSARDVEEVRGSDVDIVIDSSTDRESEAGKEAEVRKKSQRLKNKQPVVEMPARDRSSSEKARKNSKIKKEEPRKRSKEKKTEKPTDDSSSKTVPKKKWTRLHMNCSDNLRSSSVEIVDITKSDSPSSSDSNDPFKKEPLSPSSIAEKVKCRSKRSLMDTKRNTSKRIIEKRLSFSTVSKKNSIENKNNKNSAVSDDTNRPSLKTRDSSRGRKGIPKKLQTASENSSPSKSLKKIVAKREPEDSLSESDDSSKQPLSKKTRDSISRENSDNKSKLLKADSKGSEVEKSQTDRNKSPKLLKDRTKRAFSNLSSTESSSDPKVSNENIKKQAKDTNFSETDSDSSSKQTKENKKSVIVKSERDTKKSVPAKDDSRNQTSAKNSNKDSSGNVEKSSDTFSACILKKIKKEPQTEEVISATPKQEVLPSKPTLPITANPQNIQQDTKPTRVVRNLPIKKIPRRRSSQHSESELQVVLTKLPDSQVSLSNGSIPVEVVRMCESREQKARTAQVTFNESKISPCNSDVGKPPELMRLKENSATENQSNSSTSKDHSQDKNASSTPSCTPENLAKETPPVDKTIGKPQTNDRRYSESEDSECGLVIDFDRRQSVEERVPTPTFQNSEKSDDISKPTKVEGPSAESLLKEPSLSAEAALEASKKATEDACLLLHLSRSAVPPIPNSIKDIPPIINALPRLDPKIVEKPLPEVKEQSSKETKETDRDESILRTLLLETGDVASGSSHEIVTQSQAGPSTISSDSKAKLNQDVMKLLMYQTCQDVATRNPATEFDEKKIPLEQLTTDINANLLSEAEEWGNDPVTIKEKVKKLKNEIACLQFLADQKDKERIAILCFKRYKEEVLKRLKIMDHIQNWVSEKYKSPSEERSPDDPNQPEATTSTAHTSIATEGDVHPRLSPTRQVIQLAYHATVKTDVPTATVTSGESLTSQSGEKLPAVATMIANATENYGVDMRTVSRNSSLTKTIVKEVLSSRESIYSPAASGSPLPQEQRIGESIIFQKTMSTTREATFSPSHSRSPSLPELSPGGKSTHHFTKRVFSCSSSSSQSPPSLQPELRPAVGSSFTSTSSSFQPHYPLSLVVSASDTKTESSKTLHISSSSGKSLPEAPKNSPRSSPKRSSSSSYSVWSSVHTGRSSSAAIDLHTDRMETSTKRTTTASHALMVAPPPTTILQSTLKHPIHQRPRSEALHDRPLKNPMEKIFPHKTEEEPRPLSYSSIATSSNSMGYGGHNSGSSTTKSSSTLNGPPRCMGCGISDAKFLCSGCRKHWYCSAKCQTMRWPDHSRVCLGRQYNSSPNSSYS